MTLTPIFMSAFRPTCRSRVMWASDERPATSGPTPRTGGRSATRPSVTLTRKGASMPFDAYLWIDGMEGRVQLRGDEGRRSDIISFSLRGQQPEHGQLGQGRACRPARRTCQRVQRHEEDGRQPAWCCSPTASTGRALQEGRGASSARPAARAGQQIFLKYEFELRHGGLDPMERVAAAGMTARPRASSSPSRTSRPPTPSSTPMGKSNAGNVGPNGWDLTKNAKI